MIPAPPIEPDSRLDTLRKMIAPEFGDIELINRRIVLLSDELDYWKRLASVIRPQLNMLPNDGKTTV